MINFIKEPPPSDADRFDYGHYANWYCKEFHIARYNPTADTFARFGGNPTYAAYYGTPKSGGGYQFGWHVDRSTPFYATLEQAIEACERYRMENAA